MINELFSWFASLIGRIWDLVVELLAWILSILKRIWEWAIEHFLSLSLFNRLLVLMVIPAFFAVIKPSARFAIFGGWHYVNNPMSENMIGIVFLIAVSFFIPAIFALIIRIIPSIAYFIWTLYLQLSESLSKTAYELTFWHYLNLAVPLLIVALSVFSYFESDKS